MMVGQYQLQYEQADGITYYPKTVITKLITYPV